MYRRFALLLAATAALLLIAACGRDEEPTPPPVATAVAPAATVAAPEAPTATGAPAEAVTEAPTEAAAEQPESPLPPAGEAAAVQGESPLLPAGEAAAAQGESPLPQPNVLTGSAWQLTALNGAAPAAGSLVTLQFNADGSAGGSDGCNRFMADYTIDEGTGTIALVPGPGTAMPCDQALMDQAAVYTAALAGAAAFTLAGDTLTLSDGGGAPLLVFAPQQSDLADSNWEAISYNNGAGGVVTVIGEPAVTLAFGPENEVSGSAGCNTYSGTFTSPAIGRIAFGALAATEKACAQPDGIMEQEQKYLAALAGAAGYTVQGDFLDMRTADGQIAAQFLRSVPD